jgi:hypothetical protein
MVLLAASAPPRRSPVVHLESELQQLLTSSDRVDLGFKLEARVKAPSARFSRAATTIAVSARS